MKVLNWTNSHIFIDDTQTAKFRNIQMTNQTLNAEGTTISVFGTCEIESTGFRDDFYGNFSFMMNIDREDFERQAENDNKIQFNECTFFIDVHNLKMSNQEWKYYIEKHLYDSHKERNDLTPDEISYCLHRICDEIEAKSFGVEFNN